MSTKSYISPEYKADRARFPNRKRRLLCFRWSESFHHFSYRHLKHHGSIYWIHGLYVPTAWHVPVLHCLLGWGARAGNQRLGKYPNVFQRSAHWLLRLIALPTLPFDRSVPLIGRLIGAVLVAIVGAVAVNLS